VAFSYNRMRLVTRTVPSDDIGCVIIKAPLPDI
jgi:hypothetical protein